MDYQLEWKYVSNRAEKNHLIVFISERFAKISQVHVKVMIKHL